jgi:hypothetical protein
MIEKTKEINSNEVIKVISLEDVSKILEEQLILSSVSKLLPPPPPKDREIHISGKSRHKI